MVDFLLSLIGMKEYWVRISWDDGRDDEVDYVWAWSASQATKKIATNNDVVNKADMIMLEPLSVKGRKYRTSSIEPLGKAKMVKKDNLEG